MASGLAPSDLQLKQELRDAVRLLFYIQALKPWLAAAFLVSSSLGTLFFFRGQLAAVSGTFAAAGGCFFLIGGCLWAHGVFKCWRAYKQALNRGASAERM